MTLTLGSLTEIVQKANKTYGPDALVSLCMKNVEQFNTGWYETFEEEPVKVIEEASFKGEEAKSGIGMVFIEIRPTGY